MNHFKQTNKKLERLRGIFFQLGLIIAGGLTLLAFEWTTSIHITELGGIIVEEIEEDVFFNEELEIIEEKKEEKIKQPKVDLSLVFTPVDNNKKIEEPTEEKQKVEELTFNEGKWKEKEKIIEIAPVSFAQHMPHYKDCKDLKEEERKKCTQEKMYEHFGKNIKVPEVIKMQGKATYLAFVYFEINKKGKITNVKILNDEKHKIPRELEREAYNAVSSLPQMLPAKNNGKKVKVLYRVPIKFTIR